MIEAQKICSLDELVDNIHSFSSLYGHREIFANPSYEKGLLGFSLFYSFLSKYRNEPSYNHLAEDYFERALKTLDLKSAFKPYLSKSFDYPLSQTGRYIQFATNNGLLDVAAGPYMARLDEILFALMKTKIELRDFDTGTGALAAGYYFLSRSRSGVDLSGYLSLLVSSIKASALKDGEGDYYWESPSYFKRVYLGISHGSAMIISFLCALHDLGIERPLCVEVLQKAVNFLVKQCRNSSFKGLFPTKIGDPDGPMQFALCYGDVGIAYALSQADKILQEENVSNIKNLVLEDCLTRSREENLTLDASIYYGAAGLGVAFDKLASILPDKRFSERADYWYNQIPAYAIHDNEYGGFQTRLNRQDETWEPFNVSFGWGILGIGVALMQHQDKKLPSIADLTYVA